MNNQTTIDSHEVAKFAELADNWWDKEGALKTLHDINPTRLEFISQTINISGARVLDVGCGGGILSESMVRLGAKVSGIDAEERAIKSAKSHALANQLCIDYQCVPIEEFEALPFSAITCMELLEHVQNPQLLINHCAHLLEPGGFLLVSTINRTLKAYAAAIVGAEYILGILPKQTHDYKKFIKPAELAAMLRNAGLEVLALRGISYNPFTRIACLQDSVEVNYLMSCFKP